MGCTTHQRSVDHKTPIWKFRIHVYGEQQLRETHAGMKTVSFAVLVAIYSVRIPLLPRGLWREGRTKRERQLLYSNIGNHMRGEPASPRNGLQFY